MATFVNSTRFTFSFCALALLSAPLSAQQNDAEMSGPMEDVTESAEVLQQMRNDPEVQRALENAQGIFVIPDYAAASLIVGGSGGEGVLMARENGEWGTPIMYDIGSVSAGLQAGVEVGSIAMMLMSDEALESFNQENNFSLNAQAGLSIIDWSERAQAAVGMGDNDVVVWTDTEGLLAEAALAVTNINWDAEENEEYYGQPVTLDELHAGDVTNPHQRELERSIALD